jgi:hypothetical protein
MKMRETFKTRSCLFSLVKLYFHNTRLARRIAGRLVGTTEEALFEVLAEAFIEVAEKASLGAAEDSFHGGFRRSFHGGFR